MNHRPNQLFHLSMLLIPVLAALFCTSWPALRVAYTTLKFRPSPLFKLNSLDDGEQLHLRRNLQRYFSDHDVYLPLEDIHLESETNESYDETSLAMQSPCDRARLHLWVPLRFSFPIIGEKVIEWCWRPQVKAAWGFTRITL